MASGAKEVRLLALDGGGIRGLSELLILEEIMNRIKGKEGFEEVPRPCEYFDIIGGTGTGGIIAILLGRLRMSIEEAIQAYKCLAEKVFSKTKNFWQDGTFKASVLEAAMKDIIKCCHEEEDALMMTPRSKQSECKTFVCAMPAQNMAHPRLFRSYEVTSGQEYNAKIWEVARATSAAPTFFKRIFIGAEPKEEFIDAGMGCNNPTDEVHREAQKVFGTSHLVKCIISIGAGHPNTITLHKPDMFQRFLPTNFIHVLAGIATDCERRSDEFESRYGERNMRETGGMEKTYFRLNVQQGLQNVSLAEWTKLKDVKTHTVQYLRGAGVDIEVDRVVDVLRSIGRMDVLEPQLM